MLKNESKQNKNAYLRTDNLCYLMKIILLTIGKNNDKTVEGLVRRYVERLVHYTKFEIHNLPDVKNVGTLGHERQKQLEGELILSFVKDDCHVVLLDERGKEFTSEKFARNIESHLIRGTRNLVFVTGGPFGFSPEVYNRADSMMALSQMTLTHEMVRLFFVEQIYRAFTIIRGENYHH